MKLNQYFPMPFRSFDGNISVKLKNITHVDTSSVGLKTNLASL